MLSNRRSSQAAHERCMSKKSQATTEQSKERKQRTPTFLLELPLQINESQAPRLRAHLEAGRQFYNAVLSQGQRRLRKMRADPAQAGRLVRSLVPRNRNEQPPLARCASSMGFPSMGCTPLRKPHASAGWLTIWTRCWPKRSRPERTRRSIGSAWVKPDACARNEPRTRPREHREQAQRYRPALCAPKTRRRPAGIAHLAARSAPCPHQLE